MYVQPTLLKKQMVYNIKDLENVLKRWHMRLRFPFHEEKKTKVTVFEAAALLLIWKLILVFRELI